MAIFCTGPGNSLGGPGIGCWWFKTYQWAVQALEFITGITSRYKHFSFFQIRSVQRSESLVGVSSLEFKGSPVLRRQDECTKLFGTTLYV